SLLPLIKAEALLEGKAVAAAISSYSELYIDAKEIRQLILNLTMNGLEAMGPGGILKISVYEQGSEIVLSVEDRGSGIKPDIINKIRIPFFTTKDSGTGLGLPVCYSIAARHQAVIDIKSGDWGTAICVKFKKDDASLH
ncbi:MAG: ATP-binding protein, partial [Sporomusa sp.]